MSTFSCARDTVAELRAELNVTDDLLKERQRVLDAIPSCPRHGPCVPHALRWISAAITIDARLAALVTALEGIERHMRQYVGPDLAGSMIKHWADRLAALRTPEATP